MTPHTINRRDLIKALIVAGVSIQAAPILARVRASEPKTGIDLDAILNELYALKRRRGSSEFITIVEPHAVRRRRIERTIDRAMLKWFLKHGC